MQRPTDTVAQLQPVIFHTDDDWSQGKRWDEALRARGYTDQAAYEASVSE